MRSRVISIAAGSALLIAMFGSVAAAESTRWKVVDDDGLAGITEGHQPDCSDGFTPALKPGIVYQSLATAVSATNDGDTVYVCPGIYAENVVVTKSIRVRGPFVDGSARYCPKRSVPSQASVKPSSGWAFDVQASNVQIAGLRIARSDGGIRTAATGSGYTLDSNILEFNDTGIELGANGTTRSLIQRSCFRDNDPNGAIVSAADGAKGAIIRNSTFMNHAKPAISLGANVAKVTVTYNDSVNDQAFVALNNVTGRVSVESNRVWQEDNVSLPKAAISVVGSSAHVDVLSNRIDTNNSEGVLVKDTADDVLIKGNVISQTGDGISVGTNVNGGVEVRGNRIFNISGTGIKFSAATLGNLITRNVVTGVANVHCSDDSIGSGTAGTANLWRKNKGLIAVPADICKP